MPLVKYVISIVASPSNSLCTFQYSICGLSCGNVVSSTSSLSAVVRNLSSTLARVDQRVRPRELQRVDALLECDRARLADERHVFAVVDRELHGAALRERSRGRRSARKLRRANVSSNAQQRMECRMIRIRECVSWHEDQR